MSIPFAAIADDFTGGADLAGMIASTGTSTALVFDANTASHIDCTALVLCLKTRSIPAQQARQRSREAYQFLTRLAPRQLQFKYCSTFDSTPAGNLGPVIEELLEATQAPFTIAVPALPVNGRTQYLGYLFVNGVPLHESFLRHHPLNPMDDANLPRFFSRQSNLQTALIPLSTVRRGTNAIREALHKPGPRVFFIDATEEADLVAIAAATHDLPFTTGGSGLGLYLPAYWPPAPIQPAATTPSGPQRTLIVSGSCSQATLEQLDAYRSSGGLVRPYGSSDAQLLEDLNLHGIAAISSSAPASQRISDPQASHQIEATLSQLALRATRDWQVRHLIVAGGETSGAIVEALKIPAARINSIVSPGVPALVTINHPRIALALKSGNFGSPNFFLEARTHLNQCHL